jgi:hypothetical protein
VGANVAARERLEALMHRLTAPDFGRSLGGGWTVTTALAHLAFWDFRQAEALAHYTRTGEILAEDKAVNPALELVAAGMDAGAAARLAVEAANRLDDAVASLDAEAFAALDGGDHAYMVRRGDHRDEHIAQIEAALD